jgi:hypothetical protein
MNKQDVLNLKKDRLQKLESNNKNVKSGGVVRRLKREIRGLEKQ